MFLLVHEPVLSNHLSCEPVWPRMLEHRRDCAESLLESAKGNAPLDGMFSYNVWPYMSTDVTVLSHYWRAPKATHLSLECSHRMCGPTCAGADDGLRLQGVWPYWLPRPQHIPSNAPADDAPGHGTVYQEPQNGAKPHRAAAAAEEGGGREAVANDVELGQRVMLLTGANMSGKSSLMRATMATALLGSAGLPVPCVDARIPEARLPHTAYALHESGTSQQAACRRSSI
jgi:hypothetical protein